MAFGLDNYKFEMIVSIIKAAGSESQCDVRTAIRSVTVAAGEKVPKKCCAPVSYLKADAPVLFQPDVIKEWPEELQINEQLLQGAHSKHVIT